jgi:predicted transcriptional regulator
MQISEMNPMSNSDDLVDIDSIPDSDSEYQNNAFHSPYFRKKKKYLRRKTIESFAIFKFNRTGKGFTYDDLMDAFNIDKSRAQRIIRHLLDAKIIFSARDLSKYDINIPGLINSRPQLYYATKDKAMIIEKFKKKHIDKLDTNDTVLTQRKQILEELLTKIAFGPLCIHKLQLKTNYADHQFEYNLLAKDEEEINKKSLYREMRIDFHQYPMRAQFHIYSNGTIMTYINCSNYPIKIENEEDIEKFYLFLGRIEYHLDSIFSHSRREIVPSIRDWILQGFDINKDMEIDTMCQLTIPDIQLKELNQVFRMYVKVINGKSMLRIEESVTSNLSLSESIRNILWGNRNGNNNSQSLSNPDLGNTSDVTRVPKSQTDLAKV